MRTLRSMLMIMAASLPLAGCYYDPGYGYVRNGSGGDAYYGEETSTTVVAPGFYDPGYGYGGYGSGGYGYGGYGGGCCYAGGVGTVWYGGDRRYYRDHDRDHRGDGPRRPSPPRGDGHDGGDHRPPPGGWQGGGRPGGNGRPGGDRPRPPGGWQGNGGDHPRPPGGWQGGSGDHPRPPGGWQGGGRPPQRGAVQGDHRPASGGSRPASSPARSGVGQDRGRGRDGGH